VGGQAFSDASTLRFSVRGDGAVSLATLSVSGAATVSGTLVAASGLTVSSGNLEVSFGLRLSGVRGQRVGGSQQAAAGVRVCATFC
jgi:hypothetical protein